MMSMQLKLSTKNSMQLTLQIFFLGHQDVLHWLQVSLGRVFHQKHLLIR